ncbi:hypothetical protein BpHYR1_022968 [Brachionus plicatilis]|uniref:Uncharacterized protein n=1 Tax=Brachionus plicatilis TaxID=10195 RepID=A0A3M7RB05_BRAPC|nr:hypothetical protein BpHYR1_022968 [Brachionus plicatilis]
MIFFRCNKICCNFLQYFFMLRDRQNDSNNKKFITINNLQIQLNIIVFCNINISYSYYSEYFNLFSEILNYLIN